VVVIDVVYDGPDLDEVAAVTGLTVDDVIARHAAATYRCDFCGFAPGFAYLGGLDPVLHLRRRATPRTRVAAGSVAIADRYSAAYPTESPGGWHVLGRTASALWDPRRTPPALVPPGTTVRFRPVAALPAPSTARATAAALVDPADPALVVVTPGWSTSIQDRGRPGYGHLGAGAAGALDADRHAFVNRLVGNDENSAAFETAGGLIVEATRPITVADSASGAVRTLRPGERTAVAPAPGTSWAYLAVRGGLDVEAVLGSRSWDSLGRLGPHPPITGGGSRTGVDPRRPVSIDHAPPPAPVAPDPVDVRLGPRDDWFVPDAFAVLIGTAWTVSSERSRVGLRLDGPRLARRPEKDGAELASEGIVAGAIQVPPDGRPIVMLADHPTTGGYPVLAVVDPAGLAPLAQAPAGTAVRFVPARSAVAPVPPTSHCRFRQ
jgi:biotin-dependent carboxylase-like uncharacterized protein